MLVSTFLCGSSLCCYSANHCMCRKELLKDLTENEKMMPVTIMLKVCRFWNSTEGLNECYSFCIAIRAHVLHTGMSTVSSVHLVEYEF